MKAKIVVTVALLFCLFSSFAPGNRINGNWSGVINLPEQSGRPVNYIFIVKNDSLTGTASSLEEVGDLKEGKVKGDSLWFSVVISDGSNIPQSGKYFSDGDSISLNILFMGENVHTTLQRADIKK